MAATLRMTAASGDVTVLATGAFGLRVAELIATMLPVTAHHEPEQLQTAFASGTGPVILVLWRPSHALCLTAGDLARRTGRPWLPVVAEHPLLRVGPFVRPEGGACFRCYSDRRLQHDPHPGATAQLQASYDENAALGPAGFLPQHARIAARVARSMVLGHRRVDAGRPSEVVSVSLLTAELTVSPVVGWGRCDCGRMSPGRPGALRDLLVSLSCRAVEGKGRT